MVDTTQMEIVQISGTKLSPSRIGLGTWAIGGWMWGGTDEANAARTIHAALDRGITLIDTAPVYGLATRRRSSARRWPRADGAPAPSSRQKSGSIGKTSSRSAMRGAAASSKKMEDLLRRLRTDVIDLYQVHWPDPNTPIEETAGAMKDLLKAGKIRAIGLSNFSPAQMDAFRAVAPLHAVQPPYNLFERAIEADVFPYARDNGLAMLAYGSLCRGLLSGRMKADTRFTGERSAQQRSEVQAAALRRIYCGGVGAGPVRATAFRQARDPSGAALGARSLAQGDRIVGGAASGPTRSGRRRARLDHRCRRHGGDRQDRGAACTHAARPGIHGAAGTDRSLVDHTSAMARGEALVPRQRA